MAKAAKYALQSAIFLIAFFAIAKLNFLFSEETGFFSVVWAQQSFALLWFIFTGYRFWPSLFISSSLVCFTLGIPWSAALGIGAAVTIEIILALYCLRKLDFQPFFGRLRDVISFLLVAIIISALAPTVGILILKLDHVVFLNPNTSTVLTSHLSLGEIWRGWWGGKVLADIAIVPLVLVWRIKGFLFPINKRLLELCCLCITIIMISYLIFFITGFGVYIRLYMLFPPLIWAALRFNQRGVSLGSALMVATIITAMWKHSIPLDAELQNTGVLPLQLFFVIKIASAMIIAAVVSEKEKVVNMLQIVNRDLDTIVQQRTQLLEKEVSEHKMMEVELKRSNEALDRFAHIVSHDLQEPLRAISSYIQLLKRNLGKLSKENEEFMNFVIEGALRMKTLIISLLEFATLGRETTKKEVNAEIEFQKVVNSLNAAIKKSGASITHDPLPKLYANEIQFGQLLQNIISNSIKFCKNTPRIHVSVQEKDGEWLFSIKDEGIGIAPENFGRIFQISGRLNSSADYPGTGMGLTICQRIVENHKGRIWVESALGKGSVFYFTIPKESLHQV